MRSKGINEPKTQIYDLGDIISNWYREDMILCLLFQMLLAQYTYEGPTKPVPHEAQLVKIELLVRDSPELGGVRIQSVTFDGIDIPLKPPDIAGNRGTASFQLTPGKYPLRWVVQKDKIVWPRTETYNKEVVIDPRDLWVQISIEGSEASIR